MSSLPTRRKILIGAATAAVVSSGVAFVPLLDELRKQSKARVMRLRCPSYDGDLVGLVRHGLEAFPQALAKAKGGRVLLKPNLVEVHPGRPINTEPRLVAAVAAAFFEVGAKEVVVGDGPGHMRDTEAILDLTGIGKALEPLKVRFQDLNLDEAHEISPVATEARGQGRVIPISRTVLEADLVVSMPKMKTHHWAGVTLSMKNLFGTVPGSVVGWPKNLLHWIGIGNSIVSLWAAIKPGLAIVDGVVGMEGDGPIMGSAVPHGVILMSDNCPAVDAECARLMGLDSNRFDYFHQTVDHGGTISSLRTELVGDAVEGRPYAMPSHFEDLKARRPA
jgi:uncharacterized protein (DUF362 family)